MLLMTTIAGVRARREELARCGRRVAFVPTMGAIHEGHLALVRRGRELADEVWASVFVNPTQFGPGEDLDAYPRDLEGDRAQFGRAGVELLFAPSAREMYPRPSATHVSLPDLSAALCGAQRPGHFDGVALVVTKLLNIVAPSVALFGAKDFQQAVIVRRLVVDLNLPVRVEVVPTERESDGLARSSRNRYLSPSERQNALSLPRALDAAAGAAAAGELSGHRLEAIIARVAGEQPGVRVQYAAAVDPATLEPVGPEGRRFLLAAAVFAGTTRLIDSRLVEIE
jgi:pantoate--beta-alanine ligase